jgi:hypothetical protein
MAIFDQQSDCPIAGPFVRRKDERCKRNRRKFEVGRNFFSEIRRADDNHCRGTSFSADENSFKSITALHVGTLGTICGLVAQSLLRALQIESAGPIEQCFNLPTIPSVDLCQRSQIFPGSTPV